MLQNREGSKNTVILYDPQIRKYLSRIGRNNDNMFWGKKEDGHFENREQRNNVGKE